MKGLIDLIADSLRYSGSQVAGPCGKQISPSFFVKYTHYFLATRQRPDRAVIKLEWIQYVMEHPEQETIQADGRIRRWAAIQEMNHRYLRVILLPDGETVHNAFFDRSFKP